MQEKNKVVPGLRPRRLTPYPVTTVHIGCRPSKLYTGCTECPNAVPLGSTFKSAGLFAAVLQSDKNSLNGKDHIAQKKTRNSNYKKSCLMTLSSWR